MPIGAAVRRLAGEQPDRPALTCEGVTVLWRDLEPRTNRLARTLERLGVGQGDFVTIGLPNGIEFYEACIAAWKLGATPQPISYAPAGARARRDRRAGPARARGHGADRARRRSERRADPARSHRARRSRRRRRAAAPAGRRSSCRASPAPPTPRLPGSFGGRRATADQLVPGPLYHNGPFMFSVPGLLSGGHLVVLPRFDAVGRRSS